MTDDAPRPGREKLLDRLDLGRPHSARIWNYWLGGKDNYAADRAIGDEIVSYFPEIRENARGNRAFLDRAVHFLVTEAGIHQFLDIGTGLPTASNTHEVAQRINPQARIVYVDNDPLVLTHAQALLTSSPEGKTDYLDADVRNPDTILETAAHTLDFTQPIALMLLGIMQFVLDDDGPDQAYTIVSRLLDALPSGSYLVFSHPTNAIRGERMDEAVRQWNAGGGSPKMTLRTPEQVERFFDGLEVLDPGVGSTALWRPPQTDIGEHPRPIDDFGGVALKR
ncbi:SAM-dependent methyltransferase [Streptomyces sp. PSKA54]|uniref:SAM-dependent methyltransferase n=1 Tax=Streptomyces himalayensis subsp. aureolus TaxID=2758039 RepID=A0A7W2D3A7_9ACTN|nr:SAM-dependent methyltransferase [Streptomyces himalayensis]MBA4863812.1 SAM-dependent methyltransferase [Streptomyces himalayensis subsp. aureolus]